MCESIAANCRHAFEARFDPALFDAAMSTAKQHQCAGNLFWMKLDRLTASKGVPVSDRAVEQLQNAYFSTAKRLDKHVTVIPVEPGTTAVQLQRKFGNLERCSAEEMEFAILRRIAEMVRANASDEELLWPGSDLCRRICSIA